MASEASKPAKSGEIAIVPGNPGKSELLARINTEDRDDLMPPAKGHKSLTANQKKLLRRWIEQGAVYEKHWAFVPLAKVPLPAVKRQGWTRNGLDHFVLERLEKEGLTPSPEASKEALIRRVSLDLTGLPPTPAEVDAFLADTTPQAFEKVVDRLLASPRFGGAHGGGLAGCGPVCRHQRVSGGQGPPDVALEGMGDQRVQPQPAF
jgi:hypothetical protein